MPADHPESVATGAPSPWPSRCRSLHSPSPLRPPGRRDRTPHSPSARPRFSPRATRLARAVQNPASGRAGPRAGSASAAGSTPRSAGWWCGWWVMLRRWVGLATGGWAARCAAVAGCGRGCRGRAASACVWGRCRARRAGWRRGLLVERAAWRLERWLLFGRP